MPDRAKTGLVAEFEIICIIVYILDQVFDAVRTGGRCLRCTALAARIGTEDDKTAARQLDTVLGHGGLGAGKTWENEYDRRRLLFCRSSRHIHCDSVSGIVGHHESLAVDFTTIILLCHGLGQGEIVYCDLKS